MRRKTFISSVLSEDSWNIPGSISSAVEKERNFMTRNTVKRVEVAAPVYSEKIKKRIRGLFDLMLSDNKKARTEDYHGKYSMIKCEGQPCNSQEMLYQEAYDRAAIKTENKVVE